MEYEHPDLIEIDHHIHAQFDRVLRAEQEAADVARRRTSTLRDRLLDFEERGEPVSVAHGGGTVTGSVEAVAADHVEIATASGSVLVPLSAIRLVSVP